MGCIRPVCSHECPYLLFCRQDAFIANKTLSRARAQGSVPSSETPAIYRLHFHTVTHKGAPSPSFVCPALCGLCDGVKANDSRYKDFKGKSETKESS